MGDDALLLHGADWVVRSADDHVPEGAVCIEGDRIAAVGSSARLEAHYERAHRIDCRGLILTPGLVNTHNHIYGIFCRGLGKHLTTDGWLRELVYPVNERLDEQDLYNATLLVCAESFRTGTTAMVEQITNFVRGYADAEMRAFLEAGMRARVARGVSTASMIDERENAEPESELAAVREFLERWAGEELVQPWAGPSGLFACDPETLGRVKRLASEHGARYVIHLSETRAQMEIARRHGFAGQVEWADRLGLLDPETLVAHAIWITPAELRVLADAGVHVSHSPTSNMLMGSGVAQLPAMRAAGVKIALGADTPAANDAQDMVAEVKATALLQRVATLDPTVLDAKACWRMATEGGAAAIGCEGELGRLEVGHKADIAGFALAGNPCLQPLYDPVDGIVYHGGGRDVCLTLVNGQVVYERGRYPTIDLDGVLEHVNEVVVPKVRAALA